VKSLAELFDVMTRAVLSLLAACALALLFCVGSAILTALGLAFAIVICAIMSIIWARNLFFGAPAK